MTTEEAKNIAVRKAYGEHWEQVKEFVDEDGCINFWHKREFDLSGIGMNPLDKDADCWQPKSLSGIEDNNGWIRIEPDGSNLPKTKGTYRFISKTGFRITMDFEPGDDMRRFTHFRPIEIETDPIY